MAAAPTLSVIVPTFNRASFLRRALDALLGQSLAADLYEVVVVDDGSTDETAEMVGRLAAQDPRVRLIRIEANQGRSAARNRGVEEARGGIVVFVDSDVVVTPDFLTQHLEAHRASDGAILCRGPVITIPDFRVPSRPPAAAFSPAYLDTANASLPRDELMAAGLFDEGFRAYGWEDFDLGVRLQQRGLRRIFRPQAVAYHIQPSWSAGTFGDLLQKEEERAWTAVYFYAKHPGRRTRFLIQHTALHRVIYFLLTAGGLIHAGNAPALAARLRRRGWRMAEYLMVRNVLNRHYLMALRGAWAKAAREGFLQAC